MIPEALLTRTPGAYERTPTSVLQTVERVGPIALDPFAPSDNPLRARRFLTCEDNAFAHDWAPLAEGGLVYAFPPINRKLARVVRFVIDQAARGCEIVLLVPSHTDASYVQALFGTARMLCFWGHPISTIGSTQTLRTEQLDLFDDPEPTLGWASPEGAWPALFAYWGPRWERFRRAFKPHGSVLGQSLARSARSHATSTSASR